MTNMLHFESADGDVLDVPHMADALRFKEVRALRKKYKDDAEALGDAFLEKAMSKENLAIIENFTMRDYNRFISAWMEVEDEDDSLGE